MLFGAFFQIVVSVIPLLGFTSFHCFSVLCPSSPVISCSFLQLTAYFSAVDEDFRTTIGIVDKLDWKAKFQQANFKMEDSPGRL